MDLKNYDGIWMHRAIVISFVLAITFSLAGTYQQINGNTSQSSIQAILSLDSVSIVATICLAIYETFTKEQIYIMSARPSPQRKRGRHEIEN